MADWSNLPKEIVTKIVEHVEFYEDFETLRWICMPWRSAAKEANFRACVNNNVKESLMGRQEHTLPWLMLSDFSNTLRLYSLSKHMVRDINLPYFFNNKYDKITLLSSFGWLLVVSGRRNPSLFYPFTGAIIKLPTVKFSWDRGLRSYYWHQANEYKLILSANPVTTSDYIVFLSLFNLRTRPASILVFWRNGDDRWIQVLYPDTSPTPGMPMNYYFEAFLESACQDITYYQGEFYGVNCYNMIVKFDTAQGSPYFREVTNTSALLDEGGEKGSFYLVASGCQLLLVRHVIWYDRINIIKYETNRFEVFELNVKNGNVKKVSCLGNRAIFLGWNSSFSVEITSLAHGFKPNCIYHSDDSGKRPLWKGRGCGRDGKDHCLYNLINKKVERPLYNGHSSHFGTQFMWVESPIH